MFRAYKYRIYPDKEQEILLKKNFGCCRFIYNLALETKMTAYKTGWVNLTAFDLMKQAVELKRDCEWLKEAFSQSLNISILNLDKAFNAFFKGKSQYPTFKNKYSKQSCGYSIGIELDTLNEKIHLPKIKTGIKIVLDKRVLVGKIKTVTVSKTATDKYFASILVDTEIALPKKVEIEEKTAVGIDLGIKSFLVTSYGESIENPKFLRNSLKRLAVLQRRKDRKIKGSNNRKKALMRISILHERVANQRKDFLHKLSSKLLRENQTVCVEDLNVHGMIKNRKLSQSISDVGWGEFLRILRYKAEWGGKNVLRIGRFEPSSKICSSCGTVKETLSLDDRKWICSNCGITHDRDVNAAINIKKIALKNSGQGVPAELPEMFQLRKSLKEECKAGLKTRLIAPFIPQYTKA